MVLCCALAVPPDPKLKILNAIVGRIPILVVDSFMPTESSLKMLFHHVPMFQYVVFAISLLMMDAYENVAPGMSPPAAPSRVCGAPAISSGFVSLVGTSPRTE